MRRLLGLWVLMSALALLLTGCGTPRPLGEAFDRETVEKATLSVIEEFNAGHYDTIISQGSDVFRAALTPEQFAAASDYVARLGSFKSVKQMVIAGQKDMNGNDTAFVVAVGDYAEGRCIFIIGFNESMELLQFYIQ